MINKIILWARDQEQIRSLVLVGSRARNGPVDRFSDYDLSVFVSDVEAYTDDDIWMSDIDDVLVYVSDKKYDEIGINAKRMWSMDSADLCLRMNEISTRLIIFKDGTKVDLSFYPLSSLDALTQMQTLPFMYDLGYQVLLDKDGVAKDLPAAKFVIPVIQKPTQEEFIGIVREFFFEVYHVAKYLHRDDLWHAKFRDWATKELLLKMIELNELAAHDWNYDVLYLGKRMKSWANLETWGMLKKTFGHFDNADGWDALSSTVTLFRKLAIEVAETLEYAYPKDVDDNMMVLVRLFKNL